MHCKDCGNPLRRLARKGFWQEKFFPKFGYYPWECPICRKTTLHRKQYVRKRRSSSGGGGSSSRSGQEHSAD